MKNEKEASQKIPESSSAYTTEIELETLRTLEAAQRESEQMSDYYTELISRAGDADAEREVQEKAESLKRASVNLGKALQKCYNMSDELKARWNDLRKTKKRSIIPHAPANAVIDVTENLTNNFAKGLNIYKILWICYLGSFLGVVVEMLWCLVTNGYIESRSGLVYGPFNLLYGFGAAVLTAALYRFRNRSGKLSFLGGMVVGSAVEYACSWFQEVAFGTRSWDYSDMPFNLNGRICLLYSIFWGVLGLLWIKSLYPRMAKHILKIPNKAGVVLTWVLCAFFVLNAFVTSAATLRWVSRDAGEAPQNVFEELIDSHFPDERMEKIFANMTFAE